jgi:hypothetical protein
MSGSYLSAADFLTGIMGDPIDLYVHPLGTVRVRGLTVAEVSDVGRRARGDDTQLLINTVVAGMVEPQMTAEQLLAAPAGMVHAYRTIGERIAELSGMVAKAEDREKLDSFPGGGS